MRKLLLLHAPRDAARAGELTAALEALGYEVTAKTCARLSVQQRRALMAALAGAPWALVVWSRGATPGLRAAAAAARSRGTLALVRLDAARPPARLGAASVSLPRGRHQGQALSRVLECAAMSSEIPAAVAGKTSRYAAFVIVLAFGLITAWASYAVNPSFAAEVNGWAASAAAQAQAIGH